MKKLIVSIILMFLACGAYAQIADTTVISTETIGVLKRAGGGMKVDKVRLSREERQILLSDIGGIDYNADWNKAKGWRAAGISMIAGGSAVAVVGLGYFMGAAVAGMLGIVIGAGTAAVVTGAVGGDSNAAAQETSNNVSNEVSPHIAAGLIILTVGAGTAAAGIPITIVNCKRLSNIVDEYNAIHNPAPEASLSFGPTRNGIGLALNF